MNNNNQIVEIPLGGGMTRRAFIGTAAAAGGAGLTSVSLASPFTAAGSQRDVIVSVYLRGAMDGLMAVAPYGDPDYAPERGPVALRPPGQGGLSALDLDGFFGLHPAGAPLLRAFGDAKLAIIHGSGIPSPNRSHFDAQRRMETATPEATPFPIATGWLGRHLAASAPVGDGLLRGLALDNLLPATLVGGPGTLPVRDIGQYNFPGRSSTRNSRQAVLSYAYENGPAVSRETAAATMAAIDLLDSVDYGNYTPAPGANYPTTGFGRALRQVAALIKAGIALETAQVNFGGWDHHTDLLPRFESKFSELSTAMDAFYVDMQGAPQGYTLLTQTEFGRRVSPNGSAGTDHGFASCMFAMGPAVQGGRVIADWPGMAPAAQVNGDLDVTIDWRDVAAEILELRAGGTDVASVFPGYTPTFRGVV